MQFCKWSCLITRGSPAVPLVALVVIIVMVASVDLKHLISLRFQSCGAQDGVMSQLDPYRSLTLEPFAFGELAPVPEPQRLFCLYYTAGTYLLWDFQGKKQRSAQACF